MPSDHPAPATPPSILAALRRHTAAAHERLEAALPLNDPALDRAGYAALLARFGRLYAASEHALLAWDGPLAGYALDLGARRKAALVRGDLDALAAHAGAAPIVRHDDAPAVSVPCPTLGHAFGVLYVLEGSTLGGQVVLRQLTRTLGVTAASGGAFFASYGPQVGPMWRQFCVALERFAADAPHERDAVLAAADATFATFERELLRAPSPPQPTSPPRRTA